MGILSQYGVLGIYENKDSRQCVTVDSPVLAFFVEGYIPSLQFMLSSVTGSVTVDVIEVDAQGYRDIDGETSLYNYELTVTDVTTYYRVFKSEFIVSAIASPGFFYLKITNGNETYYTDVYQTLLASDLVSKDSIKIVADSANFAMGKNAEYVYIMENFTYRCYLDVVEAMPTNKEELKEAGEENALIIPNYTALTIIRSWTISGNEHIHIFLLGLGILEQNGAVVVTYLGVDYNANENTTEISQVHNGRHHYDILFKMKPENEMMRVINEIN